MRTKYLLFLFIIMLFLSAQPAPSKGYDTPTATLETFFQGVRDRDKELCATSVEAGLRQDLIDNWDEAVLPNEFTYNIVEEKIKDDVAWVVLEMTSDLYGEEEPETIWFVLEEDGWKIAFEEPENTQYAKDTCK